jgi:ferredoxin-NADP reductase
MATMKAGRIVEWRRLSPSLATFQLSPAEGSRFPGFEAGQYLALRRDDCLLTRKIKDGGGAGYEPDLDEHGRQRRGPVTHSYTVASAPFELSLTNSLGFYVVLERGRDGTAGRFTESLFRVGEGGDDHLGYLERIVGDFTLPSRADGAPHILMVGTGTGLAPFVSMVKQLDFDARQGRRPGARYTLVHGNRTREELAWHRELLDIAASKRFDFCYLPTVSRPTPRDRADPSLGIGRANNLLRHLFDLPPREPDAVAPALPRELPRTILRERAAPMRTVLLSCGNPDGMADLAWLAKQVGMRFEKEDW